MKEGRLFYFVGLTRCMVAMDTNLVSITECHRSLNINISEYMKLGMWAQDIKEIIRLIRPNLLP